MAGPSFLATDNTKWAMGWRSATEFNSDVRACHAMGWRSIFPLGGRPYPARCGQGVVFVIVLPGEEACGGPLFVSVTIIGEHCEHTRVYRSVLVSWLVRLRSAFGDSVQLGASPTLLILNEKNILS